MPAAKTRTVTVLAEMDVEQLRAAVLALVDHHAMDFTLADYRSLCEDLAGDFDSRMRAAAEDIRNAGG